MKIFSRFWILAVMVVIFHLFPTAKGATVITATITVTNTTQVGTNWIVNGNTRTWTNNTAAVPASFIQTTNTIAATASNLYQHIIRFPYLAPNLTVQRTSPTNIVLRGSAISITTNNYFHVSYSTNIGTNLSAVQVPFENVVGDTNRTNNAHWLIDALNRFPYTNALATNANVVTNLLVKGAQPYQEVLGPIGFRGRTAVNSNFFATNGFTANLTNINPVLTNGVNFGNAFRSEGPGGNSFQVGSNAQSLGTRGVAVGNLAVATNTDSIAIGTAAAATNTSAIAIGNATFADGIQAVAIGAGGTFAQGSSATAVGGNASAKTRSSALGNDSSAQGTNAVAVGYDSIIDAHAYAAIAIGMSSRGNGLNSMAIGQTATAAFSNSAAIGPIDDAGTGVAATATNQIVFGTSRQRVFSPGLYESPRGTNAQFAGTNIARGSWNYPAFVLSTLAAGNNISVAFGTNRYIRCGAGPVSAATICGIIGGATSGGLDGQDVVVMNDTGFPLTFAVNTVDPVPANRINTASAADVSIADQGWAHLFYDGTDARWKLVSTYPLSAGDVTSYNTPLVISGAGSGSTNYTLQAVSREMILGSSNVNIVGVMQTQAGSIQNWTLSVTNDSTSNWGLGFSSVTNRWFWQGTYGTNAPNVLTNDTRLIINGKSLDTNTWVTYDYFRPAK